MADTSVLVLEPAGATAEIDAEGLGTGPQGKPLRRERLQVSGAALAEIARVLNTAPAGTEYALVVRPILAPGAATDATLALVAKDATLGTVGPTPGAYTVLDRLAQLGAKLDVANAALRALVAAQPAPARPKPTTTLLHRS